MFHWEVGGAYCLFSAANQRITWTLVPEMITKLEYAVYAILPCRILIRQVLGFLFLAKWSNYDPVQLNKIDSIYEATIFRYWT